MSAVRRFSAFLAVFAAGLVGFAAAASAFAAEPAPAHLAGAIELLRALSPDQSDYQHKQGTVVWPGDPAGAPQCRTDCSGFIDALLKHIYGLKSAQLKEWFGTGRPVAKDYYAVIAAEHGFRRIPLVSQVRAGDLLAVTYPSGSTNTGHVMLVADAPRPREATAPIVAGTRQWEVTVIDESESGHGKTDTRHNPDKSMRDGLGRGVLRIYTDAAGQIAGYSWSTLKASKFQSAQTRPFVVGRLDLDFFKTLTVESATPAPVGRDAK